MKFGSWTKS